LLLNMTNDDNNGNKLGLPDARTLILDLFAAYHGVTPGGPVLGTRQILLVAEALDIAPTAVRTAITRLKQDGRLKTVARGLYGYGNRVDPWRQRIDGWRLVLARRRPWDDAWLMAMVKPASLSRTVWRSTTMALELEGFRRTPAGPWLRPDNLERLDSMRQRLIAYGATATLTTARLTDLDETSLTAATTLWHSDGIDENHRRLATQIDESLQRIDGQTSDGAAREALVLGRAGVRAIIKDPLLPKAMTDDGALRSLLEMMLRYDKVGKAVWTRRFGIDGK